LRDQNYFCPNIGESNYAPVKGKNENLSRSIDVLQILKEITKIT
jgi:hypothetical protein